MPDSERLTDDEMLDILEDIARTSGNAAARIAAIKVLKEIGAGDKPTAEGFNELDQGANVARIRTKAA